MKKQLFSLVMMLALIVIAGTSAWAQWLVFDGMNFNEPTFQIQNSVRQFTVAAHSGNSYTWNVYAVSITTGNGGAATDDTNFSLWNEAARTTSIDAGDATVNQNSIWVEWLTTSANQQVYAVEVTETNAITGSCTTLRRVYVMVYGINLDVIASDNLGVELTVGGDLVKCNSWSGDVIINTLDDTELRSANGSIINLTKNKYDLVYTQVSLSGTLDTWADGSGLTVPQIAAIKAASGVGSFRWKFDYNVTSDGTNTFVPGVTATDDGSIISISTTADAGIYFDTENSGVNYLGTDWNSSPVLTTELATADMSGTIYAPKGVTSFILLYALHNRFNELTSPSISLDATNLALETSNFGGDASFNDGEETDLTNNTSATQTRNASPATTVITIVE